MSHNILARDIQIGTENAWHSLTTIRNPILLSEVPEVRYPMETRPLFFEVNGEKIEANAKQVVAMDDGLPVGNPVSPKYSLISNVQILDMVGEALGSVAHEVVSVGTVADRSLGFVSIKLKDSDVRMARRETVNVLNVLWGHGGNMPVIAKTTNIVTVCNNTFDMNMANKSAFTLKLKHCLNALDKLTNFGDAIDAHYGAVAEFKLAMDSLAKQSVSETKARAITAGILAGGEEMSTRTANTVERIVQLFNGGAGNSGKDMADLFHGITDFYTHESASSTNAWKQFQSSEFGAAGKAKREAFDILTDSKQVKDMERKGAKSLELSMAN